MKKNTAQLSCLWHGGWQKRFRAGKVSFHILVLNERITKALCQPLLVSCWNL